MEFLGHPLENNPMANINIIIAEDEVDLLDTYELIIHS
jgi:hypothetical protein